MELAGEDAEVLLTAALRAQKRRTPPRPESWSRKGSRPIPTTGGSHFSWPTWKSRIILTGPRPYSGRPIEAKPETMIAYRLASLLISKPEGEAQAEPYIAVLRSRGSRQFRPCPASTVEGEASSLERSDPGDRGAQESLKTFPAASAILSLHAYTHAGGVLPANGPRRAAARRLAERRAPVPVRGARMPPSSRWRMT